MKPTDPNQLEELIRAHGPFLQRLAYALTSDATVAEDLVSDTWVAALRPERGRLRNERGWLATVLRRRAAAVRSKPSMISMEDADRHLGHQSSPDEVLARLEQEQLVNGALARLQEPYRSTLFLRFHDGLPPGTIAEQTSTSHKTVRTRISRGLEQLRLSLDQEMARRGASEPRAEWLSAIVPLALTPASPVATPLVATLAMKKAVALAVAALLVTVAGFWAVRHLGIQPQGANSVVQQQVGALDSQETSSGAGTDAPLGDALAAPSTDPVLSVRTRLDPGTQPALPTTIQDPKQAAEVASSENILGVAGSVILLGGPSVTASSIDGQVEAKLWINNQMTRLKVPVTNGEFRAEFEATADGKMRLIGGEHQPLSQIDGITLTLSQPHFPALGSTLHVDEDGQITLGTSRRIPFGSEEVVIYIQRAPLSRLEVVDSSTGVALTGVKVLGATSWEDEGAAHPEGLKQASLTNDTHSPVTLTPPADFIERGEVPVLVGASGYAWVPITLDLREGVERRVELPLGGKLSVAVTGEVPRLARLRLYRDGVFDRPLSEVRIDAAEENVWEALVPGRYNVRVELGEWYEQTRTLAEGEVQVEPSRGAALALEIDPMEPVLQAKASGSLFVPAGWEMAQPSASVRLLGPSSDGTKQVRLLRQGEFAPVEGLPGSYTFELPAMEVGLYEFELNGLAWKTTYELRPGGSTDLRIEAPEPVAISVQVVDAATEQPVQVQCISWNPIWPKESRGGSSKMERNAESPGLFRFNATAGPIELSCWEDGFTPDSKVVKAKELSKFTLKISRAMGATVLLFDGEKRVPWPELEELVIEPIDGGEGHLSTFESENGHPKFGVSESGRYHLVVPSFNGYQPHPPVEFDMVEGQDTEIKIHLTPK